MNHCIIQAIVSVAYNYFIPLLFSAGKIDIFERIAIIKSAFSYACYTVGDCHPCKAVTTIESIRVDFFNSVGNCISAVLLPFRIQDKRRLLLVKQHPIFTRIIFIILIYSYVCKAFIAPKSIFSNVIHTGTDSNTRKIATIRKCLYSDGSYAIGNFYTCKTSAPGESNLVDNFHTVRNCYISKARTNSECAIANVCHAVRNCYIHKSLTLYKRAIAYICYAIRNRICAVLLSGGILNK